MDGNKTRWGNKWNNTRCVRGDRLGAEQGTGRESATHFLLFFFFSP